MEVSRSTARPMSGTSGLARQSIRRLKDAQFQARTGIAFGDQESNTASRHESRRGKALAGEPHVKRRKVDRSGANGMDRVTESVPPLQNSVTYVDPPADSRDG